MDSRIAGSPGARPTGSSPPGGRAASWVTHLLILILFELALLVLSGASHSDIANHADEPAHFVTGLMVHDYLVDALGSNPMAFARDYYDRYPKVAFGHWPPVYYLIQAAWYCGFGPTKASALLLSGAIGTAIAGCLYWRLKPTYGVGLALTQALVLLTLPLVRTFSSLVMSDLLVSLFTLLAVWSFADFLHGRRNRHILGFVVWSGLGLMTKGNAAALILLPFLALPMTSTYRLLRARNAWLAALLLILACASLLGLMFSLDPQQISHFVIRIFWLPERPWMRLIALPNLWNAVGPLIAGVALIGAMDALRIRPSAPDAAGWVLDARVSLAWIISVLGFTVLSPIGDEPRYILPAIPAVLLLGTRGLFVLRGRIDRWVPAGGDLLVIPLAMVLVVAAPGRSGDRVSGYEAVARSIPPAADGQVILISSNSIGEGAFVVERRLLDSRRRGKVLRGSKALGRSSWFGSDYEATFHSTEELHQFLIHERISHIVLDDFKPRGQDVEPHHDLLRRFLVGNQKDYVLLSSFTMTEGGRRSVGAVQVYQRLQARDPST